MSVARNQVEEILQNMRREDLKVESETFTVSATDDVLIAGEAGKSIKVFYIALTLDSS